MTSVEIRNLLGGPGRRGVALAAAVLTLGLSTGVAGATALTAAAEDAAAAEMELRTAQVRTALETTFGRYSDTLHDLTAAATVAPGLTGAIAGDRLPGAQQVLVLSENYTVLAHHRADRTAPPRFVPTPELAGALELSRASGRIVATPAHVLMPDMTLPPAHRPPAFELAAPMHTDGFHGWVVVGVRAHELLDSALHGITGITATMTESGRPITSWPSAPAGTAPARTVDVAFAGYAWQVQVRPSTPLVSAAREAAAPLVMTGAALAGLLLAVIVLTADAGRVRALAVARRAVTQQAYELERARRAEQSMREREIELAGFTAAAGAHLGAPLHTIAGYVDLLVESPDETSRAFVERIGRSTERMIGVVDELTSFTAAGEAALSPSPVDLETVTVAAVAAQLDTHSGERPAINVGDLPVVTADIDLTRTLVGHLVGNALRYARAGVAPQVAITARDLDNGWWRIEVADRGIGVPPEHRDRIFAPFHRAPAAEGYPGTGLGLAICKRIATRQGGEIGVEDNPGGGSVFWFTVPASDVTLTDEELTTLALA